MTDPRMTPTNDAPVTVEQCDRDLYALIAPDMCALILGGELDQHRELQAIARHRLDTLASAPAGDGYGKWHPMLLDIVNAIHRDRGEKTQAIGIYLSYEQALAAALARPRAAVDAKGWCTKCGCGNDAAGYGHTPLCPTRPRAAVGEPRKDSDFAWIVPRHPTDAMVQAGLYHCTADMGFADLFTAFHYMVDEAQQDDAILALQSPPAKVEG